MYITTNVESRELGIESPFWEEFLKRNLKGYLSDSWNTDVQDLSMFFLPFPPDKIHQALGNILAGGRNGKGNGKREQLLFAHPNGSLVWLNLGFGSLTVIIGKEDFEEKKAEKIIEALKVLLPPSQPTDDDTIAITFWAYGKRGPESIRRKITVPSWDEVSRNYAAKTQEGLSSLMNGFKPAKGGQLLLWHGKPGTGKTYAIRALSRRWKEWCDISYITDPEAFFGEASYMMNILMNIGDTSLDYVPDFDDTENTPVKPTEKWNLLILEDTGELLTADAKERTGQSLSRFLNTVDGIIGQGLRVLVLVTTNEPLGAVHPAVSRPGRCAAEVEFRQFTKEEAALWLNANSGTADLLPQELTLAELYGQVAGKPTKQRSMGFHK